VVIVGTGLLGGSIGLALQAAGYRGRRIGVGRRMATLQTAQHRGCVDQVSTDLADVLADNQLVVLATPLGQFEPLLRTIGSAAARHVVVTDAGSTKARVCADAQRLLADPAWFVGAHPMAGSERQGPTHAAADLFRDRPCILTPVAATHPRAIATATWLWTSLGMRLMHMDPVEHDRQVAAISHLPHAAAVALVQLAIEAGALDVASSGFHDTTRVASGSPQVWADIFESNRAAVADALARYGELLDHFKAVVTHGSREDMLALLGQAKEHRDAWRHGAAESGEQQTQETG
jgi:prephenate dehydrogenase